MPITYYVRTCQECRTQVASNFIPSSLVTKTAAWQNKLCPKCKSAGLDFGSSGWLKAGDKYLPGNTVED
jgi:hypothetical protein